LKAERKVNKKVVSKAAWMVCLMGALKAVPTVEKREI
jgi:hypothetical protein